MLKHIKCKSACVIDLCFRVVLEAPVLGLHETPGVDQGDTLRSGVTTSLVKMAL